MAIKPKLGRRSWRNRKHIPADMMAACEATGVKGLMVALLGIFDTDGSHELSREEFSFNAAALGYEASDAAWASLCNRFGLVRPDEQVKSATPQGQGSPQGRASPQRRGNRSPGPDAAEEEEENLDLGLVADHFVNRYDPVLEGILRQMMGGLRHIVARVGALEETMDTVHGSSMRDRDRKMERTLRRWQHGIMSVAWEAWSKVVKGQRELLNRTARHWSNATLSSVWKRWREMVEDARGQRQKVTQVVARMRNRIAAVAFARWKEMWEDIKRQWEVASRALGRMLNRQAAIAFITWKDAVQSAKDQRAAVARTLSRMRNRHLAMTFDGWHHAVEEAKEQRERVAKVVGRMRNRTVAVAFDSWRNEVSATVSARRELLRNVANRVANRGLTLAFERWKAQINEQKEQIARAKQLAARMLNALTGRCFDGWVAFATEQKRILRRAAYAIGPGRILSVAYYTWAEHVREALAERAHANMIGTIDARLAANIEAYLENKGLALDAITTQITSLESTVARLPIDLDERMAETRLLEERMLEQRKVEAERLRKLEMDKQNREAERKRDFRVRQILKRWKHKTVSLCFDTWRQTVKEAKALLQRAGGSWRNMGLANCWRKWVGIWECLRQANLKKLEARAQRDREAQLLSGLRSVGATWFQEMQRHADNVQAAKQEAEKSTSSDMLSRAPGTSHDDVSGADLAAVDPGMTTMISLMDDRYIRQGTGARGGAQLDRDLRILERRVADYYEHSAFLRQILANVVKDPTILAAIDKSERELPTSPRAHRPLRQPPQFAFDEVSVDQIEKMMDGAGSPVRWLRSSPSRAGMGGRMGASAPTLVPVRDPRKPAGAPLGSADGSFSPLNSRLQERLAQPRTGLYSPARENTR